MSINFVMIFSPNTFAGAPHSWLATLTETDATAAGEARILNAVTRAFPAVTSVRVKDALDVVNRLVGQLGTAIRAAASVALIASVLVLAGALAAGNRARIHDAVVLKTLGATRRTLIAAFSLEYVLIGLATAVFALVAGGIAAWFVVARIMTLPSSFQPEVAVATIADGAGVHGRHRACRHMARARPQGSAGAAKPVGAIASDNHAGAKSRYDADLICSRSITSAIRVLFSRERDIIFRRRHAGVPPAAPGRRIRPTPDGTEATTRKSWLISAPIKRASPTRAPAPTRRSIRAFAPICSRSTI